MKTEKEKAKENLDYLVETVYGGNKKFFDPEKRKVKFAPPGKLALENLMKLFKEEVLRQVEDSKLRE